MQIYEIYKVEYSSLYLFVRMSIKMQIRIIMKEAWLDGAGFNSNNMYYSNSRYYCVCDY